MLQNKSKNISKGQIGENLAAEFLQKKGYRIIDRNFQARYGEIDLIAIYKNILVFVEVKTRWSMKYGKPEEAITPWKIRSIIKTAQFYASVKNNLPETMQIDVIAVQLDESGKLGVINHFENITG